MVACRNSNMDFTPEIEAEYDEYCYQMTDSEHAHLLFELKPVVATCKCGKTETASQASLELEWVLTDLGTVCGKCVKRIVREHLQNAKHAISLVNRCSNPPAFVPFEGYGVSE